MDAVKDNTLPRIHRLPDSLANQIAAGEVIERPASVVKELLENSIDAGASEVEIDIQQGGARLIRVSDNGCGIHADDVRLALERHATSKLRSQADLECINSLGFRGEALPSIASVSQFKLVSRSSDAEQGSSIQFDPSIGEPEYQPAAHPPGTTVEVNNLFFNTPARRKFLRTERTEFLHILEMSRRLALGCANTRIRLRHNDKQVLDCPAVRADPVERIHSIMGNEFRDKAIQIDYSNEQMHLHGCLGGSELARNQSDRQYFYLNGRMIRDKRINHAIRLAYESRIAAGRYPCYVLYLQMDMAAADVNVHPSKHEVRFHHARDVHDFVFASINDALNQTGPSINDTSATPVYEQVPAHYARPGNLREITGHYGALANSGTGSELFSESGRLGRVVAQLQGKFIVTAAEDCLRLVDVRAARKYIALSRLQSAGQGEPVQQRPLLVPVSISFAEHEIESFLHEADLLQEHGLTIESASPGSLILRSIPLVLQDCDIDSLMADILTVLKNKEYANLQIVMSEHAVDIQEDELTTESIKALLRSLENCMDAGSQLPGVLRILSAEELADLVQQRG